MAEPFKNLFSKRLIAGMAEHLSRAWPAFDEAGFVSAAGRRLRTLELKQRSAQITDALVTYLPDDFERAVAILLKSLAPEDGFEMKSAKVNRLGIDGWAIMPIAEFVGQHGQEHFDLSLATLRELTKRFSSEFGIRYFLLEDPPRTLETLEAWASDPSEHVRRLVSEGTRPRLPWGMRLPAFIEDPTPVLPLLETLRDDESEYVRRSVANNLNDIAKDHPDLVAKLAARWLRSASRDRERLIRHACRSLIKQGHQKTLQSLGYRAPKIRLQRLKVLTPQVALGEALQFDVALTSTSKRAQPLIIDYAIHHQKANGSTTPKVFKWKTITLEPGDTHEAARRHAIRKVTTRAYYPGKHQLELLVNGVSLGRRGFQLEV